MAKADIGKLRLKREIKIKPPLSPITSSFVLLACFSYWRMCLGRVKCHGGPIDEGQVAICPCLFRGYSHTFSYARRTCRPCSIGFDNIVRRKRDIEPGEMRIYYKSNRLSGSCHLPWAPWSFDMNDWRNSRTGTPNQPERIPIILGFMQRFSAFVPSFAGVSALLNKKLHKSQLQPLTV